MELEFTWFNVRHMLFKSGKKNEKNVDKWRNK